MPEGESLTLDIYTKIHELKKASRLNSGVMHSSRFFLTLTKAKNSDVDDINSNPPCPYKSYFVLP